MSKLLLTRNSEFDTAKYSSDFNKPTSKYLERLEIIIIKSMIDLRRKAMQRKLNNKWIDNGEIYEENHAEFEKAQNHLPYNFMKILAKQKFWFDYLISFKSLFHYTFKNKIEQEKSKDKNIEILKQLGSTKASRRPNLRKSSEIKNLSRDQSQIKIRTFEPWSVSTKTHLKITHNIQSIRDMTDSPTITRIESVKLSPYAPKLSITSSQPMSSRGPADESESNNTSTSSDSETEVTLQKEGISKYSIVSILKRSSDRYVAS